MQQQTLQFQKFNLQVSRTKIRPTKATAYQTSICMEIKKDHNNTYVGETKKNNKNNNRYLDNKQIAHHTLHGETKTATYNESEESGNLEQKKVDTLII